MSEEVKYINQNVTHPGQLGEALQATASLTKILLEVGNVLNTLRREFRGEAMYQDDSGNSTWIQLTKPMFIKVDNKTRKPITEIKKMPWGEDKTCYVPNDEAIDEILSMLKFMGINQISPIGTNTEDNYLDDLKEFECKLAGLLCLKQKGWGIDKECLPMIQTKIKTIVQDVRSMSVKGKTIDALTKSVQRVEQMIEGETKRKIMPGSPY